MTTHIEKIESLMIQHNKDNKDKANCVFISQNVFNSLMKDLEFLQHNVDHSLNYGYKVFGLDIHIVSNRKDFIYVASV